MNWSALTIAVVGGDEREQEIARLAAETGAEVRAYGFPWPSGGIFGVHPAPSAREAMDGAHVALFPIPGIGADGSLFAPSASEPILPTVELLDVLQPEACIVLGLADDRLRDAAQASDVTLYEYETDRELMLLRAPAIVEGAIAIAVEHTDVTLHASDVAVLGYGSIGTVLAGALVRLGARMHVVARNPVQRAAAHAAGAQPWPLEQLTELAPRLAVLFSTVPGRVVDERIVPRLDPACLVIDLAAPPGSVDLELVRASGRKGIWARGLGRRAPVTVGRSQWKGISARIEGWAESSGEL